jgi:molybdopterin molybdotransferase
MISFDEACALLFEAVRPLGSETVPLSEAAWRIAATPQRARSDAPLTSVSTMDGYAVREEDLAGAPVRLEIAGESLPGRGFFGPIGPGQCARVFTGAAVPDGCNRVVMQEVVRRDVGFAVFEKAASGPRFVRVGGSDFRAGEAVVEAGTRLTPFALVAAAAADVAAVQAYVRPQVSVLTNGDELAEPGEAYGIPGAVPDSVSLALAAFVEEWGGRTVQMRRLKDEASGFAQAAEQALGEADLVVVAGGASVGERDLAKAAFAASGLELVFSQVAIKPGRPVWLGRAHGRWVLGLPGNPTSALVTARLFLAPLLCGLAGADMGAALRWEEARLADGLEATGDRETFYRARREADGVRILPNQDSGAQKTLASTDRLVRRSPGSAPAEAGEAVSALRV